MPQGPEISLGTWVPEVDSTDGHGPCWVPCQIHVRNTFHRHPRLGVDDCAKSGGSVRGLRREAFLVPLNFAEDDLWKPWVPGV